MKKFVIIFFVYLLSQISVFAYSEIDDVASVEGNSKEEYKKIDKEFYLKGLRVFRKIRDDFPDKKNLIDKIYDLYKDEYYLAALKEVENLSSSEEKEALKGIIYGALNMMSSAEKSFYQVNIPELEKLKRDIIYENKYEVTPFYGFLSQDLSEEYDLDYQKVGITASKFEKDAKIKLDYRMINYTTSSHQYGNDATNTLRLSVNGRYRPDWEYRVSAGVKFYEKDGSPMAIGDLWVKHHFNDNFSVRAGVSRENLEQSYLAAVGVRVDGVFTGRVASNKVFVEANYKAKNNYYGSLRAMFGLMNGANLQTNPYFAGYVNLGKRLYNNAENPYVQKVNVDITNYTLSYKYDLLNIYDSTGYIRGGYFSPPFYNGTTANIRVEGVYKKLSYGLKGFIGGQFSDYDHVVAVAFGVSPYIKLEINERIDFKASYTMAEFADVKTNLLTISFVIKI